MSVYRITTRFDLEDERQRRAAEHLKGLKWGDGNRFVVEAVLASIEADRDKALLESIRRIIREERFSFPLSPPEQMKEGKEENEDMSVLDDLELFG